MPAFFLELFSEEIPARMQARGADDLARLIGDALGGLRPSGIRTFYGPRRIALAADVAAATEGSRVVERGPRAGAPEQAIAGFLRKHGAAREQLRREGDYWVLERSSEAIGAATIIAGALPSLLRRFPWPKSMRWGGSSAFTWVRPLRRITCLLDGAVVAFSLQDGEDDGHGLVSGNETEAHRFLSPGPVDVRSVENWAAELRGRHVLVEAAERKRVIADCVGRLAAEQGLAVVEDPGLLDEVAGLVEWPVPLLGRIDPGFMDLPPEVMQVSMRANQRYFALRGPGGDAAPFFAFVANTEPADGGQATIAGNERVLRARFADARHFWDGDRRTKLADRVPALDGITFHAKLGSLGERVRRIETLSVEVARATGAHGSDAERAAHLAKADLVTGMVGEFPELQGVMGRYYALYDGEPAAIADAIRDHYAPKGPSDAVPGAPISIAVALADKLDLLAGFFAINEKPSGSGDPYALRRAALGVIRIVRENGLGLSLLPLLDQALDRLPLRNVLTLKKTIDDRQINQIAIEILDFVFERLRIQLREDGARHDVLAAVFAGQKDDDLNRLITRTDAVVGFLNTLDGASLLTTYRRATNILRVEDRRDGPHEGSLIAELLTSPEEKLLHYQLQDLNVRISDYIRKELYSGAMAIMTHLRPTVDAFFDHVTVNAPEPALRRNRLRLLAAVRATMDRVADFSRIEG